MRRVGLAFVGEGFPVLGEEVDARGFTIQLDFSVNDGRIVQRAAGPMVGRKVQRQTCS